MTLTAKAALVRQLEADGVRYIFGNPGTTEQGWLEEIEQSTITYVLGMQETAVVATADGYARSAEQLGVVQLHSSVGLGNGIGMLYHAWRANRPMLVLVGDAGVTYDAFDAWLAADLVGMAKPACKAAFRVMHPGSVLRLTRRAIQTAQSVPQGPVLLALPADVMDQETAEIIVPTRQPVTRVSPDQDTLDLAAELLRSPGKRTLIVGDGVALSGAQSELVRVAEALDAEVFDANSSEVNIDSAHPLYGGALGHLSGDRSTALLKDSDVVLVVGTYLFPELFPSLASPFRPDVPVVHIDLDEQAIGKSHPVTLGIVADPRETLRKLAGILGERRPLAVPEDVLAPLSSTSPLEAVIREIAQQADKDNLTVIEDALSNAALLSRYLPARVPGRFMHTWGGSLGAGIPSAIGAKLAFPERQVVSVTGDGGAMYTPQALWTAHRYEIAAKFVVCNNHRYKLLDENIEVYWRTHNIPEHKHPRCFDLAPSVDYVGLARSMGVEAARVSTQDEAQDAVKTMLAYDGPYLVEALV